MVNAQASVTNPQIDGRELTLTRLVPGLRSRMDHRTLAGAPLEAYQAWLLATINLFNRVTGMDKVAAPPEHAVYLQARERMRKNTDNSMALLNKQAGRKTKIGRQLAKRAHTRTERKHGSATEQAHEVGRLEGASNTAYNAAIGGVLAPERTFTDWQAACTSVAKIARPYANDVGMEFALTLSLIQSYLKATTFA